MFYVRSSECSSDSFYAKTLKGAKKHIRDKYMSHLHNFDISARVLDIISDEEWEVHVLGVFNHDMSRVTNEQIDEFRENPKKMGGTIYFSIEEIVTVD